MVLDVLVGETLEIVVEVGGEGSKVVLSVGLDEGEVGFLYGVDVEIELDEGDEEHLQVASCFLTDSDQFYVVHHVFQEPFRYNRKDILQGQETLQCLFP